MCVQNSDPQFFKGHTPFIVIIKYLLYLTEFFSTVLGLQKNGGESREVHTASSHCIPAQFLLLLTTCLGVNTFATIKEPMPTH